MIFVYTGNGKGKTSACLGQAVRALGRGLRVGFGQFMKRDGEAGEQTQLKAMLGDRFMAGGKGFFRDEADRPAQRQAALDTLTWGQRQLPDLDVLILDEAIYALGHRLLTLEELQVLIELSKKEECHLILSGRGFPEELHPFVDLITEMTEIKHPWRQGVPAVSGLDF